ncbi:MAG: hypothetical protein KGY81_01585, partial [Phycisphaerae bacterium]|nr:hypothetical protein [Phycisphaerae bacterium]
MSVRFGRHDLIFVVLLAAMGFLGVRLVQMVQACEVPPDPQHADVAERIARASLGSTIVVPLPGRPGDIYARGRSSHVLMAGSRQVPSCFIDPSLLNETQLAELSRQLSGMLGVDPGELYVDLLARRERGSRFAWVKRQVTDAQADAVRELDNRAVGIQYEWRRDYPLGSLAGPVLGFTNDENVPGGGVHLAVFRAIQARQGRRVVLGDAGRRPIWGVGEQSEAPVDGCDVYLTIDVNVQETLQKAVSEAVTKYDAQWGTGVVINPWTGDVLAMASAPTFDPNNFGDTPPQAMLNRAIATPYEPGSALKPIFAAAAVERGVLSWQSRLDGENGVYHAHRGGRISDHGRRYGLITLWKAVVKSSNIVMAKVGEMLG